MKRFLLGVLAILALSTAAKANQNAQGWCESGNQKVVTSGLQSTTKVQASYPSCTVTVFIHGGGLATIYSDNSGTPLSNPFTAQTGGRWLFYGAQGRYDIQLSGAGFSSPVTYSDVILSDSQVTNVALLPNINLPFSATPTFDASQNQAYTFNLTGNVTSSVFGGTPANGNVLALNLCQTGAGGFTFVFPANAVIPSSFTFNTSAAPACNYLAFKFDGITWTFLDTPGGAGSTVFYQTVQQAGSNLPQQTKLNFPNYVTCVNNGGNSSTDCTPNIMVGAGGSNAAGLVPAPGPTVHNPKLYLDETGAFSATPTGGVSIPNPLVAGSLSNGAFPWSILGSVLFGGPSPNIDVQTTGARPLASNNALNAFNTTNLTASINSGTSTVSLCTGLAGSNLTTCQSTVSGLVNGDGITVLGAGTANTLSTPGGTYTGTVNTSGTSVTWVSGQQFVGVFEPGATININSVNYVIASGNTYSGTSLTLTTSAGTQTGVSYTFNQFQVFPAIAAAPTGTGYVVPAPGNATSYTYKIAARTTGGAITAASTAVTISNGVASLGAAQLAITSCTKSNGSTATCLTATRSPEVLAVGMEIRVSSTSDDANFGGWTTVTALPDNTHFSYATQQSTVTGGTSSATGGTIQYWNANHIILPLPPAGVLDYAIYGRVAGDNYTLIGVSHPAAVTSTMGREVAYMKFDDYGSTMSANGLFPAIWPATAPASATANSLTTTIVSGAGTTTLTVANAAGTTVSNVGVAKDDAPGILAAYTKAANPTGGTGMVYLSPAAVSSNNNYQYTVNSYLDLCTGFSGNIGISIAATLFLNDTVCVKGGPWHGDLTMPGGYLSTPQFGLGAYPTIFSNRANPGLFIPGTGVMDFDGLNINNTANMGNSIYGEGSIPIGTFKRVAFFSGSNNASQDYLGIPLIVANGPFIGVSGIRFTDVNMSGGPAQSPGLTSAPLAWFGAVGGIAFDGIFMNRRGIFARMADSGMILDWNQRYENQGPITPTITVWNANGPGSPYGLIYTRNAIQDTSVEPVFTNLGCQNQLNLESTGQIGGIFNSTGCPLSSFKGWNVGGQNFSSQTYSQVLEYDGSTNPTSQQTFNTSVRMGQNATFLTDTAPPPAPTCTASPGSGLWLLYSPVYATGGIGPLSQPSATECAVGVQTVSIPALVNGAVGYWWWGNSVQGRGGFQKPGNPNNCSTLQPSGLSFTLNLSATCGTSAPTSAGGGPVSIANDIMTATRLIQGPRAAPSAVALASQQWFDSTALWPSFNVNGVATNYRTLAVSGAQTIGHTACFVDTTTGSMTDCAGGAGNISNGSQWSVGVYNLSGVNNGIGPTTGPTTPNGVFQFFGSIPSAGAAAQPIFALAGLNGRSVSGASDTILVTDRATVVTYTNAGATAITLPQAGTAGFANNFVFRVKVQGSGAVATITPTTSTINGGATLAILQGQSCLISSDNTNYSAACTESGVSASTNITLTRTDFGLALSSSAGGGTVTHTAGNLTLNQLVFGNGTADIKVGDLTGDCTTSGGTATTCSQAAKWTTARLLAGNSVDGSANVAFANKFIVQGTTDTGLSGAQFLGALGTGIVRNTTTTGVLSSAELSGDCTTSGSNAITCTKINGVAFSGTNGNLVSFSSNAPADSGIAGGNVVTAAANFTSGNLIQAAASNKTTSDSGIAPGNVVTAASAAGAANQVWTSGGADKTASAKSLADLSTSDYVAGAGSVNVMTATLAPAATALTTGMHVRVLPNLANTTTTPTLNVNGLTGKTITKCGTNALVASDYTTAAIAEFTYDGTNWQLLNPQAAGCGAGGGNMVTGGTNTMGASGTLDGSAMATTAGMKAPVGAGAVPTADGAMANNSTNHTFVWGSNGTTMVGAIAATGTGTATTCTNQVVTAVSSLAVPTCSSVANAALTNSSVTYNGQAVSLGSTGNVNSGATAHSVAINQGNGSAITGVGAGTTGQFLRATTSADPTYSDFPDVKIYPAAACNNATAGAGWNLPATNAPTVACRAGTNNLSGVLQWANNNTTTNAQFSFDLPNDWDTASQPYINIYYGSGANTSGTVKWTFSSACTKADGSVTDDPAFVAETTTTGKTMAVANRMWSESVQFANMTSGNSCIAGSTVYIKITSGNGTATSTVNVDHVVLTTPRLLTVQAN